MNVQVSLFENDGSTVLKSSSRIEENSGGKFDVRKLVSSFEVLATSEGGIQKLRELVLALAVRGSLVQQHAAEGSSDALVAELAARRAKLSSVARVRADLAEVPPKDQPFIIPSSWRWQRLGHLGGFLGGGTPSKSNTSFWKGSIPWVSPKDMKRPYIDDAEDHISEAAVEGSAVKLIPRRSILFVVRGMILAHSFPTAMTTKTVTINQDMKALVPAVPDLGEYLLRACWAARDRVLQRVERSSHGTCRLDSEAVEELPIPIPPLSEQRRIVAKVDELMCMLDDLEAKHTKMRETQVRFRSAALGALTSAKGADEFDTAWKRVANHFDVLFEKALGVGDLRRVVLGLAIRGRLTDRVRSDEPAHVLMERFNKERVAARGTRSRTTKLDTAPFELPPTWAWARLDQLCRSITDGDHQPPPKSERGVAFLTIGNISRGTIDFTAPRFVGDDYFASLDELRIPRTGDLLYTIVGTLGIPVLVDVDRPFCVQRHIAILKPLPSTNVRFLLYMMKSDFVYQQALAGATGIAQPTLGLGVLRDFLVPVPPLAEQKRIVAKVEQLMKLCDNLEAKLHSSEATASKLVEAVVAEMVA